MSDFKLHNRDHLETVAGILNQIFHQPDFTDVTLVCDDAVLIPAHSIVLSACSPLFALLLKCKDQPTYSTVYVTHTNPSHLQSLLTMLHCGQVTISREDIDPILDTARQLHMTCLTADTRMSAPYQDLDEFFDFDKVFPSLTEEPDPVLDSYSNEDNHVLGPSYQKDDHVIQTLSKDVLESAELVHQKKLRSIIKNCLRGEKIDGRTSKWLCLCCDKRWVVTTKNARLHMESHLPARKCHLCPIMLKNREIANRHMKKVHINNNKAADEKVERGNVESSNMVLDLAGQTKEDQMELMTYKLVRLETEGESIWCCLVCGKSWVGKNVDKRRCRNHMETHLVGVELSCVGCNKVFVSKISLAQHNRYCRKTGEKVVTMEVVDGVENKLVVLEEEDIEVALGGDKENN